MPILIVPTLVLLLLVTWKVLVSFGWLVVLPVGAVVGWFVYIWWDSQSYDDWKAAQRSYRAADNHAVAVRRGLRRSQR